MTIDLAAAIRRVKPEQHLECLAARPYDEIVHASDVGKAGRPTLLLDTNVYILSAAGRLPPDAVDLVERALLFHCTVCIGELTTGITNADPTDARWKAMVGHYRDLLASLPPTRVLTPDHSVWAEAGLIAGTLARTQTFQPHQRKECLNDALIFLTAARAGLPVLTANRREFDLIEQIAQRGGVICFELA